MRPQQKMRPLRTLPVFRRGILAFALSLFFALPALSASAAPAALPDMAGAISQTPETARPREAPPRREEIPGLERAAPAPQGTPDGETLYVREFRLTGVEFLPEAELLALLEPLRGRNLTLAQIEEAAARVTQYYQERGYILTRAYLPQQDARDGTLTVAVIVGRYGEVQVENRSLLRDSYARGMFSGLQPGDVARQKDLERKMLLVADLPGAAMPNMAVAPGKAFATANLGVTVPEGKRLNGYLSFDNQGSRYTGRYRLGAGLDVNSPLGIGDRLTFSGVGTDEFDEGLLNGRLAYSAPLGYSGLRGEIAAERTAYELNKEYRELDSTGYTDSLTAALSYPLLRRQDQNLWLRLSGSFKHIIDEIGAFDEIHSKHSLVGSTSAQYERWFRIAGEYRLYATAGLGLTHGNLRISNEQQRAFNRAGADTVGDFTYATFNFMANYAFTQKLGFNLIFNAQQVFDNKNLDGSEQFIASGPSGVRGYRETVSGDNGYLLNGELRYQLPEIAGLWKHSLGLFGAVGRTHYADGEYLNANGDTIYDAGLGYYANCGMFFGKAQLSQILGQRPEGIHTGGRTQFLFQVGLTF